MTTGQPDPTPEIEPAEAQRRAEGGSVHLVDVRELDEWLEVHSDAATHVPLGDVERRIDQIRDDAGSRQVAFVCRSGRRSAMATDYARQLGIDAVNVRGGMLAWQDAGLPVA